MDNGYITQDELAKKLGKTQSTIANKLRLLNLDETVQDAILKEKISERHARSLLRITSKEEQRRMLNEIIDKRLTVRQTDDIIKEKYGEGAVESNMVNISNLGGNSNDSVNSIFKKNNIATNNTGNTMEQSQKTKQYMSMPEANIPNLDTIQNRSTNTSVNLISPQIRNNMNDNMQTNNGVNLISPQIQNNINGNVPTSNDINLISPQIQDNKNN